MGRRIVRPRTGPTRQEVATWARANRGGDDGLDDEDWVEWVIDTLLPVTGGEAGAEIEGAYYGDFTQRLLAALQGKL